jgi:hypothetical protein
MYHQYFADSADLTMLTKAMNDYCRKHKIEGSGSRERVAARVIRIFQDGVVKPGDIALRLDDNVLSLDEIRAR